MLPDDFPTPGTAEYYCRFWSAAEGIAESTLMLQECYDLDPALRERMLEVCEKGTPDEERFEALQDFLAGVHEALEDLRDT